MKYYDKKLAAHGWWNICLGVLWIAVSAQEYENWLRKIKSFKIDDDWVAEVTELAVDCFC